LTSWRSAPSPDGDNLVEPSVDEDPAAGDLDRGVGVGRAEVTRHPDGLGDVGAARGGDTRGRPAVEAHGEPVQDPAVVGEDPRGLAPLAPGVDVAVGERERGHRPPDGHLELVQPRLAGALVGGRRVLTRRR
jgi:hypothetical protein